MLVRTHSDHAPVWGGYQQAILLAAMTEQQRPALSGIPEPLHFHEEK
jgi:hypothetical protein